MNSRAPGHPPTMRAPHSHNQLEINYLFSGRVEYLVAGGTVTLRAGELLCFWAATPHQMIAAHPPCRFVHFYLPIEKVASARLPRALEAALWRGAWAISSTIDERDAALLDRWRREMLGDDPIRRELAEDELCGRLRRLGVEGWRDAASEPIGGGDRGETGLDKARAMARFVVDHSHEPIRIEHVAAAVGLHPNYAMKVFKNSLGLTIGGFLLKRRLECARALLASDDADIAHVAFASGFGSVSRFYEAFRRAFGETPRRYRASRAAGSTP